MSINQLYAEANTFDIMLFRSSSIAAKTIRLYTQSEWDHVGIVVRKNQFEEKNWQNEIYILEATGNGGCSINLFRNKIPHIGGFYEKISLR